MNHFSKAQDINFCYQDHLNSHGAFTLTAMFYLNLNSELKCNSPIFSRKIYITLNKHIAICIFILAV